MKIELLKKKIISVVEFILKIQNIEFEFGILVHEQPDLL